MYETDFNESKSAVFRKALSQEDRKFLEIMDTGCTKIDGHYQLPLPFRNSDIEMPNNKLQAIKRLEWTKRKLMKDAKLCEDYIAFMNDIFIKGYAKKAEQDHCNKGRLWYIPHHCVYHPKKPNKIRVVFDCSAQFENASLNKELLQGPELANTLVGVLIRFRKEVVAFTADIEAMFYQVHVPEDQQSFLRFLWWPNGNLNEDPEDYQMCVHLFGGISSPSCANYALKKAAQELELEIGSDAAYMIRRNFYVDDLLASKEDIESTIASISSVRKMCAAGGFHLTKFTSNEKKILESIAPADRSKEVQKCDLTVDKLPVERALGIQWCIESDTLGFRIVLKDKPLTRRGVLSTISSIYDPFGLVAPYLLNGKKILQQLCCEKKEWDDSLSEEQRCDWMKWRQELTFLEDIKVEHSFKPKDFGAIVSASLHNFSDASSQGYGQASYLRLVDSNNNIHCSLVMGKSRISPLKQITIPRLELTAATVSVKVSALIEEELDMKDLTQVYWTDSQIVLGYIVNEKKRFKVFVANRVEIIRKSSDVSQWRFIDTKHNPADIASHGISLNEGKKSSIWFNGPKFLWSHKDAWPDDNALYNVSEDDPELTRTLKVNCTSISQRYNLLTTLENRYSDWMKMKRIVAIVQKFILKCKKKIAKRYKSDLSEEEEIQPTLISVGELQSAENAILRMIQEQAFSNERQRLEILHGKDSNSRHLKRNLKKLSPLFKLDPFLDKNGIIRVGGSMKHSSLEEAYKYPVVLPKKGKVSYLIIQWCHFQVEHAGRGITLNEIRSSGYWIINANSKVRHFISKCVRCRFLRGKLGEQKMGDLPTERTAEAPPFTYCGVDLFGPFAIKEGRKLLKRYGVIFTCFGSRAVHIETVNSLETDSFIQALRRFMSRRGAVRQIFSDNGGNFIGAERELQKEFESMDHTKIGHFAKNKNTDWIVWKKNVPAASHMGGVWERQIRSIRAILSSLLKNHGNILNDESLRTLLVEAEAVVNSRPLTVETLADPFSYAPITPNHLLTMKSEVVMPPPGEF